MWVVTLFDKVIGVYDTRENAEIAGSAYKSCKVFIFEAGTYVQ